MLDITRAGRITRRGRLLEPGHGLGRVLVPNGLVRSGGHEREYAGDVVRERAGQAGQVGVEASGDAGGRVALTVLQQTAGVESEHGLVELVDPSTGPTVGERLVVVHDAVEQLDRPPGRAGGFRYLL